MMKEWGLDAAGLDPTEDLIHYARREDTSGEYVVGSAEALPYEDASFDIATSCLVLIDLPELAPALREMHRVLKPGGRAIVATLTPIWTSIYGEWEKGAEGKHLRFPLDNYGLEHAAKVSWSGIEIVNHHWPQSSLMTAFLEAGFQLTRFEEPAPPAEKLRQYPWLMSCLRVPPAQLMEWRKK